MKPVIVTVDTEGHVGRDPVRHLMLGQTEEGSFGVEYIMDVFDAVGARVLFFVDMAAAWEYGQAEVAQVVRRILARNHDVGVHIHPDHMADPNRPFLWQYSRQEQYEIIKSCTELYTRIVGRPPRSFRAGKYGADRNTLDILCELGYQYDFSQFYHQKWCGIQPPLTINSPRRYGSLTEFPVTMHQSVRLGRWCREDKLDVEQMISGELEYALSQIAALPCATVTTLFVHSFSALRWLPCPDTPEPDEKKCRRLEHAAAYVADSADFCYISEDALADVSFREEDAMASAIRWRSNLRGMWYTYQKAKAIAGRNKKARLLVLAVRTAAVLLLGCLVLARMG